VTTIPRFELEPRRTWLGSVAAFGARRMVRFAQWRALGRARREVRQAARGRLAPQFRGFIQINRIDLG
jgi:hypothetical protein